MARAGRVRHTITGSHVWVRPNEKVKLRNFNKRQVNMIKPTLVALDHNLQPHVQLNAKIKISKPGRVERQYKGHYGGNRNTKVGALTYPHRVRKNVVVMNPKTFHNAAFYNPGGVLTHEVGHLAYVQAKRHPQRQWQAAAAPNSHRRTRQSHDVHEDFAESFRASLNQPLTRRKNRYFDVELDQKRKAHLNTYYLKNERSKAAKKGWRKRRARGKR